MKMKNLSYCICLCFIAIAFSACQKTKSEEVSTNSIENVLYKLDAFVHPDKYKELEERIQKNDSMIVKIMCQPISQDCRPFDILISNDSLSVCYLPYQEAGLQLVFKERKREGMHDAFYFDEIYQNQVHGQYVISRDVDREFNYSNQRVTYISSEGKHYIYKYSVLYNTPSSEIVDLLPYAPYINRMQHLLVEDPMTLLIPVDRLVDTNFIAVQETPDHMVRTYLMDAALGRNYWETCVQYSFQGKYFAKDNLYKAFSTHEGDFFDQLSAYTKDLYELLDKNGEPIYMVQYSAGFYLSYGQEYITAFRINKQGEIEPYDAFPNSPILQDEEIVSGSDFVHTCFKSIELSIPENSSFSGKDIIIFDSENQTLYVEETQNDLRSGKYVSYQWDGIHFTPCTFSSQNDGKEK